jgi:hypothetical protein
MTSAEACNGAIIADTAAIRVLIIKAAVPHSNWNRIAGQFPDYNRRYILTFFSFGTSILGFIAGHNTIFLHP